MNFLFDLYGTLADIKTDESLPELWSGFAALLGESDGEAIRAEYSAICKRYSDAKTHNFVEFDLLKVFEEILENHGVDPQKAPEFAVQFRLMSREKLRLFPHVIEMLDGLRARGAGVYLVSNAQACFTRSELDELGLTSHFDGILISSEAGTKKPDLEIFYIAIKGWGLKGQKNFYVGNDMHDDVLGAFAAGLETVYIETEQSGKYPDIEVVPNHIVATHTEMRDLLWELAQKK